LSRGFIQAKNELMMSNMKKILCLLVGGAISGSVLAGLNPKDDVKATIVRLAQKPNYSWTTISKDNHGQANSEATNRDPQRQFQADEARAQRAENLPQFSRNPFLRSGNATIDGKAVIGGIACLSSKIEDGTVVQVATKGDVSIVKAKEGWMLAEESQGHAGGRGQDAAAEAAPGQRDPAGAGAARGDSTEGAAGPRGQLGFGGDPGQLDPAMLMTRRLQFTRSPIVEAQELLSKATNLKLAGSGSWVGELPEASVRDLFRGQLGGNRDGQPQPGPRLQGTKATVKFWAVGGILSRYETSIETTLLAGPNQDREISLNRTSTTDIRQVGMTRLDLPKEAFALLLGPIAVPRPAAPPAPPTKPKPKPTEEK